MRAFSASVLLAIMALCGCSGGGSSSGPSDPGGGDPGGGDPGGNPVEPRSCQDAFTPEKVMAGENCDPALNRFMFCPPVPGSDYFRSRSVVIECPGVDFTERTVSGGGFQNVRYFALRGRSGPPESIYMPLHYLGADADYFANLIRLSELAIARNVLVIVPQAPPVVVGGLGGSLQSRWPTAQTQPVESYLQLLDSVVADARDTFDTGDVPLYASGLSNGVPMAYFYACGRPAQIDAVLAVAGSQNDAVATSCQLTPPVGLVIVHGTSDPVVPYNGVVGFRSIPDLYETFKTLNQCSGADGQAVLMGGGGRVEIDFAPICAGGRRVVLATAIGNGHNWPGDDVDSLIPLDLNVGLLGPSRDDIDATIQGYDLLRYAAGH